MIGNELVVGGRFQVRGKGIEPILRAIQLSQRTHALSPPWSQVFIFISKHLQPLSPLLKLTEALDAPRLDLTITECGQEHCCQKREDGNGDQQLDNTGSVARFSPLDPNG